MGVAVVNVGNYFVYDCNIACVHLSTFNNNYIRIYMYMFLHLTKQHRTVNGHLDIVHNDIQRWIQLNRQSHCYVLTCQPVLWRPFSCYLRNTDPYPNYCVLQYLRTFGIQQATVSTPLGQCGPLLALFASSTRSTTTEH